MAKRNEWGLTPAQEREWALEELFHARRTGAVDHPPCDDVEEEALRVDWLEDWARRYGLAGECRAKGPRLWIW